MMKSGQHVYTTTRSSNNAARKRRLIISNNAAGIHQLPSPPPSLSSLQATIHRNSKSTACILSTLLLISLSIQIILVSYHDSFIINTIVEDVQYIEDEIVKDMEALDWEVVEALNAAYEYNNNNNGYDDDDDAKNDDGNNGEEEGNNIVNDVIKELENSNQQQQQQQLNNYNGPTIQDFCGTCMFRNQDFNCNQRVEYVVKRRGKTEEEAKLANLQYCLTEEARRARDNENTNVMKKQLADAASSALLRGNGWVKDITKRQQQQQQNGQGAPFLLDRKNLHNYSMEPLDVLKRAGVDPNEGYVPSTAALKARKALQQNKALEKQKAQLPSLAEIQSLYGSKPYIHGLDRCQSYRDAVDPEFRLMGPAGLFNSATNLAGQLLKMNCVNNARIKTKKYIRARDAPTGIKIQAPWGKHNPVYWRLHHEAKVGGANVTQEHFLPIVMIKDPVTWMASMCRHSYEARWPHMPNHCPNLVANKFDRTKKHGEIIPVRVKFATKHIGNEPLPDPTNKTFIKYDSLVHFWNRWYTEWYNNEADFPRLMVRFEDLLFHAEETITQICDCAGMTMRPRFRYVEDSAKGDFGPHAGSAGFLASVVTYGNSTKRMKDILTDEADYKFAKENLDQTLMKEFGYAPL